ncbi:glycosyltransferase family 4 protein [Winogradskyella thalassocola]|uniref:Phosphatidylinositol alpha-1,6-mannosyltransferase n=1 Tax=Winogradskyella thalassocola TaxID=262004 RepID=A0A1G8FZV1_9FLAO|nr:glycosyltransferase family 4 protein [Winogradskyella thalassocola]SDH87667.1 phosphatidylinositol alpha-1,6-mannosyltransferase [Winogradskyella thalassocola]
MNATKILIVTSEFPPQPGGIGDHAYNVALYLSRAGYDVSVIADQRSINGNEEANFDTTLSFKMLRVPMTNPRFKMYFNRISLLRNAIRSADVVIASGKFSLWSVAILGRRRSIVSLAVIHGSEVNFSNRLLKVSINSALQQFVKVIAVSHFTKSLIPLEVQKKTVVIPNGFNSDKWNINTTTDIQLSGTPKLITVGHVSERKGQHEVIKLLPRLILRFPNIAYHCVGLPTAQTACELLAKQLGVEKHVFFHGRVSNDVLKTALEASDVFVMLSTATTTGDVEGFGIALLEANALGIPAIGAKGCGIEDAIRDGESGFLVTLGDQSAFEDALEQLLTSKEAYAKTSKKWADEHQWDIIIKNYIEEIEKSIVNTK